MLYCTNYRSLGEGLPNTAVNCGNHQYVDSDVEKRQKESTTVLAMATTARLQGIGFQGVVAWDVIVRDDGFTFGHDQPLTFHQLDALAREFGTKRINFVPDAGGYQDTAGYHPDSLVEVISPEGWRS